MLIIQLGREHTLYFPQGHSQSGAGIGSLQIGQLVVLLAGSVGMGSPSGFYSVAFAATLLTSPRQQPAKDEVAA
jgi:hypothetical protein